MRDKQLKDAWLLVSSQHSPATFHDLFIDFGAIFGGVHATSGITVKSFMDGANDKKPNRIFCYSFP